MSRQNFSYWEVVFDVVFKSPIGLMIGFFLGFMLAVPSIVHERELRCGQYRGMVVSEVPVNCIDYLR